MSIAFATQVERSPDVPVELERVSTPSYGRYLADFVPEQVFVHPRGYTFDRSEIRVFARTFMQGNPIYLNQEAALAHGFSDLPASPQMVFNVVLSLGVQNDSEKAIANLGYYNARFLRAVYPGDTVRALTAIVSRRDRGPDKAGIVDLQTLGLNQRGEVVLAYERKIMVGHRPVGRASELAHDPPQSGAVSRTPDSFPWIDKGDVDLALRLPDERTRDLTGKASYFEDFSKGMIIVHANGRTISDEHIPWTYRVGNTHPLHYDRVYSQGLSGPMSGEPIVYGGLVFAWLEGLASRDTSENALWEVGFTEGYHTQPAVTGDTLAALSRIVAVDPVPPSCPVPAGIVTIQLIGVKNIAAAAALQTYGADLFVKESVKRKLGKEKIPAKIFEIERQLLIKRRP